MRTLSDAFEKLRAASADVPRPMRLPTEDELAEIEAAQGMTLPDDLRRFFLEVSDVVVGTLEPATISNPAARTYFPKLLDSAKAYGVADGLLPFCEDNADFYCLDGTGRVVFWSHNGATNESWKDLAAWIDSVWLHNAGNCS